VAIDESSLLNKTFLGEKSFIKSENNLGDNGHCKCALGFRKNGDICVQREEPQIELKMDFDQRGKDIKV